MGERLTFLEHVAMAARETVYSAALGWLLGEDSPLSLAERIAVLGSLTGSEFSGAEEIETTTEEGNVDLRITVTGPGAKRSLVAVENKIKSVAGKDQLRRYGRSLDDEWGRAWATDGGCGGRLHKVFLTLAGEPSEPAPGWHDVDYRRLVGAIRAQPAAGTDLYVRDLCDGLERLVEIAEAVGTDQQLVEFAFGGTGLPDGNANAARVARLRLKMVVQRIWMVRLAKLLPVKDPWRLSFDETNGQAILNIDASPASDRGIRIGLQVQQNALKVFACPDPYPKDASFEQKAHVERVLKTTLADAFGRTDAKISKPRKRGFSSFTQTGLPSRSIGGWATAIQAAYTRISTIDCVKVAEDMSEPDESAAHGEKIK